MFTALVSLVRRRYTYYSPRPQLIQRIEEKKTTFSQACDQGTVHK
jgi:hypothetical protein